ncbi:MAG: hypothetical protein HYZ57_11615 [Acidobacteria bacterium]|nr:hypothetical protein [Acidobacteriota bacterium]MBI3280478.1 hypothetical protein [Acidobacteriota bacterium]
MSFSHSSIPEATAAAEAPARRKRRYRWYHKLGAVLAVVFCFELGVFLLVFPWASDWHLNYLAKLPLWGSAIWASPYFRGAVSGLGVVNIYISFVEVYRLRRFSQR